MLPFKYLGVPKETLIKLDAVLEALGWMPDIHGDDPLTAPITVDPNNGYDPGGPSPHRRPRPPSAVPPIRCRRCSPGSSTC